MASHKRNETLDIIKGVACIAMVIAHQPYFFQDPTLSLGLINHIASVFPPVLFFSVAGVTAGLQASKYSTGSLLGYFLALFVIGMTWTISLHGDISSFYWPEIFQIIAIGSAAVCIAERSGPLPQTLLLALGAAIIVIKPIVERFWPHFDGWNFLFCDDAYVPDVDPPPVLPGFPIFPWAAYFFLGAWSYRASYRAKLTLCLFALGLTALTTLLGSAVIEKWNTSLAYSLTGCTVMFAFFWLFDKPVEATTGMSELLRKLGSNAFLFFFAHLSGLLAGGLFYAGSHNAYVSWMIAIGIAILVYNLFSRCKPWQLFEKRSAWYTLAAIILLLPLLPTLHKQPAVEYSVRFIAVIIGTIAAINFSLLAKLIKTPKRSSDEALAAGAVHN